MTKKVALVTGASRGIGRGIAEALAKSGRRVIACARDRQALDALAEGSENIAPFAIDLGDPRAALIAVEHVLSQEGQLDELVCAAGIVRYAPVGEVSKADLYDQLTVNFATPFLMAQHAAHGMRARGGAMLFVSSTLATRPAPRTAAYAASKAALNSLTLSLAHELAPRVRVNALSLGVVDTDMIRVPREYVGDDPDERARLIQDTLSSLRKLHPLGRLGRVDDVVDAALYLLSASWVTGTILTVDGGLSAR
jgi:NAD(P)-dependent dehydrogenase (short-subunit alcohol dehydrogenase family)